MKKTKTPSKVEVENVESPKEKGMYHVFIKLNDKSFEINTNDIGQAIMSVKPTILKTALTVRVTNRKRTVDRYVYLMPARRLLANDLTLYSFVKNLFI